MALVLPGAGCGCGCGGAGASAGAAAVVVAAAAGAAAAGVVMIMVMLRWCRGFDDIGNAVIFLQHLCTTLASPTGKIPVAD